MALKREADGGTTGAWLRQHAAGAVACVLGIAALAAGLWMQLGGDRSLTEMPDVRVTVPLLAAALGAGIFSLARREGAPLLPLTGMAMAGTAVVLGYALLVLAVALGAGVLLAIVHELM